MSFDLETLLCDRCVDCREKAAPWCRPASGADGTEYPSRSDLLDQSGLTGSEEYTIRSSLRHENCLSMHRALLSWLNYTQLGRKLHPRCRQQRRDLCATRSPTWRKEGRTMRRKALNNRWSFSKQCEALPLAQSTKDAEEEQGGKSNNCIFSRRDAETQRERTDCFARQFVGACERPPTPAVRRGLAKQPRTGMPRQFDRVASAISVLVGTQRTTERGERTDGSRNENSLFLAISAA